MVDALRCRVPFKFFYKCCILYKKHFEQFTQIRVFHTFYIGQHFPHHLFNIPVSGRNIICWIVFTLFTFTKTRNIHLDISLKTRN